METVQKPRMAAKKRKPTRKEFEAEPVLFSVAEAAPRLFDVQFHFEEKAPEPERKANPIAFGAGMSAGVNAELAARLAKKNEAKSPSPAPRQEERKVVESTPLVRKKSAPPPPAVSPVVTPTTPAKIEKPEPAPTPTPTPTPTATVAATPAAVAPAATATVTATVAATAVSPPPNPTAVNSKMVVGVDGSEMFGLDAELYLKEQAKRDLNKEWEVKLADWIEVTVGEPLIDKLDLWLSLKSGVVLCKLVNKIKPGTIASFNQSKLMPLLEMDNIQIYLKALWQLGVNSRDLFVTPDLYKKKGMGAVLQSIYALNLLARKLGYRGKLIQDEISKASEVEQKRAKAFATVEAGPKKINVDELMTQMGGPEGRIHALQLKVGELRAELLAAKGVRASLKDEISGLHAKLGLSNKPPQDKKTAEQKKKIDDLWADLEASHGLPAGVDDPWANDPAPSAARTDLIKQLQAAKTQDQQLRLDLENARVSYALMRAQILEKEDLLADCDTDMKTLLEQATYCLDAPDSGEDKKAPLDENLAKAQSKLKALLSSGGTSTMDPSAINMLNAFVVSEAGRRLFTVTMQQHLPQGEVLFTKSNFQLLLNLLINMLGEMLVSKQLDFHTVSVIMDTCQRVYHQNDDARKPGKPSKEKDAKAVKCHLQKEPEIRMYFCQLNTGFWEEYFWHKLTQHYKKGGQETEDGRVEEGETQNRWTLELLLEFSWEMSTWGMELAKVKEITNEVAYFGLALNNALLAELLGGIEPFIKARNAKPPPPPTPHEEKKYRRGSILEGWALVEIGSKKRERRYFVLTSTALVSFKHEKTSVPSSYTPLNIDVVVTCLPSSSPDEWVVNVKDPSEEDVATSMIFTTREQRSEWAHNIDAVLIGAEESLPTEGDDKRDVKRTFPVSSTTVTATGGSLTIQDVMALSTRMRAVASGPRYNQPIDKIALSGVQLGKYLAPFFDDLLRHVPCLVTLSLINCGLGDRGVALLANILAGNSMSMCVPSLTKLELERNGITKVGAARLSAAIAFNQSISEVNLSLNQIQDVGAKAFADCLQTNTALKTLTFHVCGLTDKAVKLFLRVLDPDWKPNPEDGAGICIEMGCVLEVDTITEKGKTRKSAFCQKHRPPAMMPGPEPLPIALLNNTLTLVDVSGNSNITGPVLAQLQENINARTGKSRKGKEDKPELTASSTVEEVVAWAKRAAKISPSAVEYITSNKLGGAEILELGKLDSQAVEEYLQEMGFTRGAAVMLAKAIVTTFAPKKMIIVH